MEKRDFFNLVLNYFLVVSKDSASGVYSISDYMLKKDSFDLSFRSSNSKIILDKLNPIRKPLIKGFKTTKDIRVLPPTEDWESLTISIGNNLSPINLSFKKMINTEIPVIDLNDLKFSIKSGNLSVPIYLAKLDLSSKSDIIEVKRILLRKFDISQNI